VRKLRIKAPLKKTFFLPLQTPRCINIQFQLLLTLREEEELPEPKYKSVAFMLKVTVWNRNGKDEPINEPINEPIKLTKA